MPQTRKVKFKSKKEVFPLPSQQHYLWTIEDKKALVRALQLHGFGNLDKLSKEIKNKTKNEIELFIGRWKNKVQRDETLKKIKTENSNEKLKAGRKSIAQEMKTCSVIEIWHRIIASSISTKYRGDDYSELFEEVFKNAAVNEEHVEAKSKNHPNFQAIYKYFQDILSSNIPSVVSPADSAIILSLMQDLKNFVNCNKLQEERNFLENFYGASKYYPVIIKKEPEESEDDSPPSKKKTKRGSSSQMPEQDNATLPGPSGSNLISESTSGQCNRQCGIPDEWFDELQAHKKLQENLNPLTIPVYLFEKEQDYIKEYLKQ